MNTIPLTSPEVFCVCYTIMGEKTEMHEKLALKGTTTIGITCRDGVILASDTRVTMGFFVAHKKGKKIYQIDDHMAMTISGIIGMYIVTISPFLTPMSFRAFANLDVKSRSWE